MKRLRIASLCTGYGGLDLAVESALGVPMEHAFVAEVDPAASVVLAARFPGVPNLGDIKAVDWTRFGPVYALLAGYPCQGESLAGKRRGIEDERWLWTDGVFPAIRDLRPGLVFLENVPGHLSMGFGRVLADLASIGYVGSWRCVRAADVGAPHRRERVFILAHPADAPLDARRVGDGDSSPAGRSGAAGALLPTPRVSDANGAGSHGDGGPDLRTTVAMLPTPTGADSRGTRNATSSRQGGSEHHDGWTLGDVAYADRWGRYGPAIAHWEAVLGRPAPDPTEPGKNGPRLAAPFVEWLMGLPAGWVTDHVKRNDALRLLGNGVVVQQGAHAYQLLTGGSR